MLFPRYPVGLLLLLFCWNPLVAQWDEPVFWDYKEWKLDAVLEDISQKHGLRFSYSRDFVELGAAVTYKAGGIPLESALTEVLDLAAISFIRLDAQVVLKKKKQKPRQKFRHRSLATIPLPKQVPQMSPLYPFEDAAERLANLLRRPPPYNTVVLLPFTSVKNIDEPENRPELRTFTPAPGTPVSSGRLAQVSLIPYVGTNAMKSSELVNRLSVNVVWGTNGGVSGFEIGGLINHIRKNVVGLQLAGLGNVVNGSVKGMQFAGAFNVSKGDLDGIQFAALINSVGGGRAVQITGGMNLSYGNISGFQGSGLVNRTRGNMDGLQVAGLVNTATGKVRTQIALLGNRAEQVRKAQLGLLLNKTTVLEGFQFALVNITDTVTRGALPVSFLTIVKSGYNRMELSAGDFLSAGLARKVGTHAFYNIFYGGFRWQQGEQAWGLGYGIGSAPQLGRRFLLNLELLGIQVKESAPWFQELHLLNQFRCLLGAIVGRRTEFFAGPTANLMLSKKYDPETDVRGSAFVPPTLYDFTDARGLNRKFWVGFNAGLRF